jgi:hypothetical protein
MILVFGCSNDTGLEPPLRQEPEQPAPVDGTDKSLFPPGYYTIYWPFESTTGVSLERINRLNGQGTFIWDFSIPEDTEYPYYDEAFLGITPFGIAFDREGTIYALFVWLNPVPGRQYSRLVRVDRETGVGTFVGDPILNSFAGPEMDRHDTLYATGFEVGDPAGGPPIVYGDDVLYRIDTHSGVATAVGHTGRTDWMDLEFDRWGRLWATTENKLWVLNTHTGTATFMTEIYGVPQQDIPGCCPEDWPYMEVMSIVFDNANIMWATAMRGFSMCTEVNSPVMRINVRTGNARVIGYTNQVYNHGGDFLKSW